MHIYEVTNSTMTTEHVFGEYRSLHSKSIFSRIPIKHSSFSVKPRTHNFVMRHEQMSHTSTCKPDSQSQFIVSKGRLQRERGKNASANRIRCFVSVTQNTIRSSQQNSLHPHFLLRSYSKTLFWAKVSPGKRCVFRLWKSAPNEHRILCPVNH